MHRNGVDELFDKQITENLKAISRYIERKGSKRGLGHSKIYAARSRIHGIGVFAGEDIKPGTKIVEYIGEVVGKKMADKREKFYKRSRIFSTYLFKIFDDLIIDATLKGNLARFINHCCHPNATSRISCGRIFIYSICEIKEGEEITFYYNFSSDGNEDTSVPCYCGHSMCMKFLV